MSLEAEIVALTRNVVAEALRDNRARYVSQHTSEDLLGIPRRSYLEWVREPGFPLPVARRGRLRLVELEPLIAHLRSVAAPPSRTIVTEDLDPADRVLRDVLGTTAIPVRPKKKATRRQTGRLNHEPSTGKEERTRTSEKLQRQDDAGKQSRADKCA